METIVIYSTKKGSSKIYAKAFAENRGYPIFAREQISQEVLSEIMNVYYFGSVYAGKVLGLEELKQIFSNDAQLTIISVGLTSENDHEKLTEIREGIVKEFPQANSVHLRGRLSKEQLKLPEKLIIKMISKTSQKKAASEKLDIEKAIEQVERDGGVDCIDLDQLSSII